MVLELQVQAEWGWNEETGKKVEFHVARVCYSLPERFEL